MRSSLMIAILSTLPVLVFFALSAPPLGAVAVLFWPGMADDRQLALIANTQAAIRTSGPTGLWVIDVATPTQMAQVRSLPAVLFPAFGSGCAARLDKAGPTS